MADASEGRRHGRLEIELGCRLASDADTHDGLILNLGIGGALVRAPSGFATVGQTLGLEIDRPEPALPLLLMGEVVRARTRETFSEYGVRFLPGPPSLQDELAELVTGLAKARADGASPRVHRRLEVRCQTRDQLRATMLDIGHGGVSLRAGSPSTKGETMVVSVTMPGLENGLQLPGVVESCTPEPDGAFLLSVAFSSNSAAEVARMDRLIHLLLLVNTRPR